MMLRGNVSLTLDLGCEMAPRAVNDPNSDGSHCFWSVVLVTVSVLSLFLGLYAHLTTS
jgi:hypothetical protein